MFKLSSFVSLALVGLAVATPVPDALKRDHHHHGGGSLCTPNFQGAALSILTSTRLEWYTEYLQHDAVLIGQDADTTDPDFRVEQVGSPKPEFIIKADGVPRNNLVVGADPWSYQIVLQDIEASGHWSRDPGHHGHHHGHNHHEENGQDKSHIWEIQCLSCDAETTGRLATGCYIKNVSKGKCVEVEWHSGSPLALDECDGSVEQTFDFIKPSTSEW